MGEEQNSTTSRPYNLVVVIGSLIAALFATYLVLNYSFDAKLIKSSTDLATVMGALGGLFTLIGTVAGAYFGIKLSGDQVKHTEAANKRAEAANKRALNTAIEVDPKSSEAQNLRQSLRGG
jgi:ABC-type long-subunit fatty acid transport system fused permease/ATPase subunit